MGEGNADAVGAKGPVEGVRGWSEVCEEGDGVGEGGEFRVLDWGEAVIVECTMRTDGRSASCVDTAVCFVFLVADGS